MKVGIDKYHRWGVPACICVTNAPVAPTVKLKAKKSQNESVTNHSAMSWPESTKWVSVQKGKPGNNSWKGEGLR